MASSTKDRLIPSVIGIYTAVLAILAIVVSFPETGELIFRGYFIQDADEVIRAWYGRCSWRNPNIIPFSHLSMPGWTAALALGEGGGRLVGLPLTLPGRLITVGLSAWCLTSMSGLVRAVGGTARHALIAVLILAVSPAFFLLSVSVYPSIGLAAVVLAGCRFFAEDRFRAAAIVVGWAPLIRWEGVLIVALFAVFLAWRRAWRTLPWLFGPYVLYLVLSALRFGNPWAPLAYRTTKHMGSWLIFNPDLPWERLRLGLINLATFFSPAVLLAGLPIAAYGAIRHFRAIGPLPFAFAGLTVALGSIHHEWIVYALRVFATPLVLGIAVVMAVAVRAGRTLQIGLIALLIVGTLASDVLVYNRINNAPVPAPGRARADVGFHAVVRYADASSTLDFIAAANADWVIVNHLNANLLRADETCSLYDHGLRLGGPRMSLGYEFTPAFEIPTGSGLVVFHTLPIGVDECEEVLVDEAIHQRVYRCTR